MDKGKGTILKQPVAKASLFATLISLLSYYMESVFDRLFLLSPDANRWLLLGVATISLLSSLLTLIAFFMAKGQRKWVFLVFFLITIAVMSICTLVAGLIASAG